MSINAQWLIDQSLLPGFNLLAGDTSLSLDITGINFMDNPDTVPWITPGTFILSTGYNFSYLNDIESLITSLSQCGCSGLGIKMNRYIDKLPDHMIRQANKLHFPILSIPFSSNMSQISELIYHQIFEEEMDYSQQVSFYTLQILKAALQKKSLSSLTTLISKAIHSSVFLTDDTLNLLECSLSENTSSFYPFTQSNPSSLLFSQEITDYFLSTYHSHPLPYISRLIPLSKEDSANTTFEFFSIELSHELLGFLVVMKEPDTIQNIYSFIQNLKPALTIAFQTSLNINEKDRSGKDAFFQKVLSGKVTSSHAIETLCIHTHFPFESNRICLCLQIPEYEPLSIAKRRSFERKLVHYINDFFLDLPGEITCTVFQNIFVIFWMGAHKYNGISLNNICKNIGTALLSKLKENQIDAFLGISPVSSGVSTIRDSYQKALSAITLGSKLHTEKHLFLYFEDSVYHSLFQHYDQAGLIELYNLYIGKLARYDQEKKTELVTTLRSFLDNSCNAIKTARQLFVHRNTIFYRIDQIQSILQVDLSDITVLYLLRTGFYCQELLKIYQ